MEKVLRENTSKDYVIARAETARDLEQYICLASVFLPEVTKRPDYTMEDRLEFVLEVDETSEPQIAEQVCQAKKDGLIDQFIYGSISANYFVALMDTL